MQYFFTTTIIFWQSFLCFKKFNNFWLKIWIGLKFCNQRYKINVHKSYFKSFLENVSFHCEIRHWKVIGKKSIFFLKSEERLVKCVLSSSRSHSLCKAWEKSDRNRTKGGDSAKYFLKNCIIIYIIGFCTTYYVYCCVAQFIQCIKVCL